MEVKASLKHLRTSPRKVRLVADLIRGKQVDKALNQLKLTNKKVTLPLYKLLMSAVSNAENNFELDKDNLLIKEIRVDDGATLKRWMPRAHGRATPIRKRSSHVHISLGEIVDSGKEITGKKTEISEPTRFETSQKKEDTSGKGEKVEVKDEKKPDNASIDMEKGKEFFDPARQTKRGGHDKIEGGTSSKAKKMFRRKSG